MNTKPKSKDWEEELSRQFPTNGDLIGFWDSEEEQDKPNYSSRRKLIKFIRSLLSQTRKEAEGERLQEGKE